MFRDPRIYIEGRAEQDLEASLNQQPGKSAWCKAVCKVETLCHSTTVTNPHVPTSTPKKHISFKVVKCHAVLQPTIGPTCTHLPTSVSGAWTNLNFFRISIRAILASITANLIPMQLRGPQPKGMWQNWGRLAFSSGVNLTTGCF